MPETATIEARAFLSPAVRRAIMNNPDRRAEVVVNNLDPAMEAVVEAILKDDRFNKETAEITVTAVPRRRAKE